MEITSSYMFIPPPPPPKKKLSRNTSLFAGDNLALCPFGEVYGLDQRINSIRVPGFGVIRRC